MRITVFDRQKGPGGLPCGKGKHADASVLFGMKSACTYILAILILLTLPGVVVAAPEGGQESKPDIAGRLFEHVVDGQEIEIFPGLEPIILPQGLSVHLMLLILAGILVAAAFLIAFRKSHLRPGIFTLALESIVAFIRDDIVYPSMGEERGEKWLPFFTSLFTLILVANFLGLIPAFKAATGNLAVSSALALLILALIFVVGIAKLGLGQFFKNLVPDGAPLAIGLFVAFLELMGTFIKALVLSIRLFANMFAGHLAILSFVVLMFILNPAVAIIGIPFALFTYALEVLVCFLQAFVFTLLSCIFITMASSSHEH